MSQDEFGQRLTGGASGRLATFKERARHALVPRERPSAARASPGPWHARLGTFGRALALAAALGLPALPAAAQMAPGDAVVSGFSGAKPLEPPGPSPDPLDSLFIDTGGTAARVLRLQPSGPPQAQLIPATPVLEIKAGEVGQVFAITLAPALGALPSAESPPDIYLGATAAFGLQIVKPGPDGRPQRLHAGDPAAGWMDGQFGTALGGGPGSIYKVDGRTGAATLFATLDNSGPGLGDVVYDPASRQFFVSNLDTGLIHRLDANGTVLDTFDHGLAGRPAQGLPPVADDGVAMDIRSPTFKVEDPATWGFTPAAREVYGMAVFGGRLYYAVAEGSQVWSVGIRAADGAFAGDPRLELDVPNVPPGALITDLAFDGQGRLYVALRGAPRGSYDYVALAEKSETDVKRFRRETPNDPATPGYWVPAPDEYAIGFPDPFRNAAGGVALGYDHDASGAIKRGACGGYLWSTGDNLRNNPAYAAQLTAGGALEVHGLQGNVTAAVRPQNQPPLASYFADYDGTFGDAEHVGHVGDVEIWQQCQGTTGQAVPGGFPPGFAGYGAFGWPGGSWPLIDIPGGDGWHFDDHPPFNLTLIKTAGPCDPDGASIYCSFTIQVTNTGPTTFVGPIEVHDQLAGNPAINGIFVGAPPWACVVAGTSFDCKIAMAMLNPGDTVSLTVWVAVATPPATCQLTNLANLVWPGGFHDANPGDDASQATADLPCNDLKLEKDPAGCTTMGADTIGCSYYLKLTNVGPGPFSGPLTVTDTVPAGTTATFSLGCFGGGPQTYTCSAANITLAPNATVSAAVTVLIPKAAFVAAGCQLTNTAAIVAPAAGTPMNGDLANDTPSATASAPQECPQTKPKPSPAPPPPPPPPVVPLMSTTSCPPGYAKRSVAMGVVCEPIETPSACRPGWTFAPPPIKCCPPGRPWNGRQCGAFDPCKPGWTRTPVQGLCCPPGEHWNGRSCQPRQPFPCGPGWTKAPPPVNCCPPGKSWTGRGCGIIECPRGMTGTPPNCRPIICPPGTTGTPPNCRTITCPRGMVGTPPNCRRIEPVHCPRGMIGSPPNCRRPAPVTCPPGLVGRPPHCHRPSQTGPRGPYPQQSGHHPQRGDHGPRPGPFPGAQWR